MRGVSQYRTHQGRTYLARTRVLTDLASQVYKPSDEEQFTPNNTKGYVGDMDQPIEGLKAGTGILSGQGCFREVAAFLLDHGGRANVPPTMLVELWVPTLKYNDKSAKRGPKVGSLQAWVDHNGVCEDFNETLYDAANVQNIAVLDIRLLNVDRNSGNLFVQKMDRSTYKLIPIDHGFCLPSRLRIMSDEWVWLNWPQVDEPVGNDLLVYIRGIDIEADLQMLHHRLGIAPPALHLMRCAHLWLLKGVEAGLTLKQIASAICRCDRLSLSMSPQFARFMFLYCACETDRD
jgi:hypothetical protein